MNLEIVETRRFIRRSTYYRMNFNTESAVIRKNFQTNLNSTVIGDHQTSARTPDTIKMP